MNSCTAALLRKDRPWLLGFLLLGALLSIGVFRESGFPGVFVVPRDRFAGEFELAPVPCAVLLALVASLGETLRSTRELLRHRRLTPGRIFWTRHLAALAVIAGWTAAGVAALWLGELLLGAGGDCADPGRFGVLAAMTAGLALDYALLVLALSLPASWFHRSWLAGLFLFLRYALQSALSFTDPSWITCLAGFALGAGLVLLLAARCESAGCDADRPTPARALAGARALAVAGAAVFGAIAASGSARARTTPRSPRNARTKRCSCSIRCWEAGTAGCSA